jgi:predicted transcriptional regulator of viral defense system
MTLINKPAHRLLKDEGVVRSGELESLGESRVAISRLVDQGFIERVGRGLYTLPDRDVSANFVLARAAKRIPRGVVCLLSALQFHGMTTQLPRDVWMAIGEKDWRPASSGMRIRIVRFSPASLQAGVVIHRVDGVGVPVFNPAKTIADCFKYRNKLGLDVAIEALRDGLRERKCTADELSHYARVNRVSAVMRPYMEALASPIALLPRPYANDC